MAIKENVKIGQTKIINLILGGLLIVSLGISFYFYDQNISLQNEIKITNRFLLSESLITDYCKNKNEQVLTDSLLSGGYEKAVIDNNNEKGERQITFGYSQRPNWKNSTSWSEMTISLGTACGKNITGN